MMAAHGFDILPTLPKLLFTIAVSLALLIFWFARYAARLHQKMQPCIILEEIREIPRADIIVPKVVPTGKVVLSARSGTTEYVLRIRNKGAKNLENCLVKVDDIKGEGISNFTTSRALKSYRQNEDERKGPFNLRAGEPKDIVICCAVVEGGATSPSSVSMMYEAISPDLETDLSPRKNYEVTVGIYGAPAPTDLHLKLGLDTAGIFRVRKREAG